MILNVIKSYRDVVTLCDSDLLGKTFEEGQHQLEIKESFYKGEEKSEAEVLETLQSFAREDATFNIVGKDSASAALKAGITTEDSVKKIQDIPFVLVLM